MTTIYNIRQFDPNCLTKRFSTLAIIGPRATGKTTLITKDLLHRIRSKIKIIVTPNEGEYSKHIDHRSTIDETLSPELLERVVTSQMNTHYDDLSGLLLILDDSLDSNYSRDQNLHRIFMNGRSMKINMIFTQQYPLGLPPDLRANTDYIFLFRERNISNKRKLYNYYVGMFPSFDDFCLVFDQITDNYGCLVIDNTTHSNQLEDQVFWYKTCQVDPQVRAVTVIANQWRQIQAKRKLVRLRIGFELKLLPGIGIKYQEAANRFKQVQSDQNQFYD